MTLLQQQLLYSTHNRTHDTYTSKIEPNPERHKDEFTSYEIQFLQECMKDWQEVVYSIDDIPIGPCECATYKNYCNAFQSESSEELSSFFPYVCKHCSEAFEQGDKTRLTTTAHKRRTYYNFSGQTKLVLYPFEDWLGENLSPTPSPTSLH